MYKKALVSLTVLFFMMGFITCLNDILVPYLKGVFQLSYAQAALIQFCFFGAYGLMSIPASKWIERVGYQTGMVFGFGVTALGCILFYPAVSFNAYALFLGALFILATGVVLLQVAANPFVSIMGPPETASSRLTLAQAFNSFGTFLAPLFGSYLILSRISASGGSENIKIPYLFIAAVLMVVAIALSRVTFPKIESIEHDQKDAGTWSEALKNRRLILGMVGIFTYVGAEVAIGSFLISYILQNSSLAETEAAHLVAFYWGGAMVGRFIGISTLKKYNPGKVLLVHAILSALLVLVSINLEGMFAVYALVAVGFWNSIMFPTIFTLAIRELPHATEKASGLLSTSILGGAFIPLFTGKIADVASLRMGFSLSVVCYLYIAYFGWKYRE